MLRRRFGLVLALAFALLLQGVAAVHHATAMAAGTEICSAEGSRRVAAGDTGAADAPGTLHDCGCPSAGAAPPAPPVSLATHVAPAPLVAAPAPLVLAAEWLVALSRGPPRPSAH